MATSIQDFVDTIAVKASIDPAAAETAVGTILSAIQQEGDATKVSQLFNEIPGAADLAQKHPVVVGAGGGVLGSLSGLASNVVGKDAGVLVAAIGQLEETNLTLEQIRKHVMNSRRSLGPPLTIRPARWAGLFSRLKTCEI